MADHRRQDLGGDNADRDAIFLAEVRTDAAEAVGRVAAKFGGKALGSVVEFGEMIAPFLDMLAQPIERGRGTRRGAIGLRKQVRHAAQVDQSVIETGDRLGDAGVVLGDLVDLVARNAEIVKHAISKHLGEVAGGGAVAPRDEIANVDVVGVGEAQQHLRGQRTLVALEVIEIASGDAELFGHAGLIDAEFTAQHAQTRAEIELSIVEWSHACRIVTS